MVHGSCGAFWTSFASYLHHQHIRTETFDAVWQLCTSCKYENVVDVGEANEIQENDQTQRMSDAIKNLNRCASIPFLAITILLNVLYFKATKYFMHAQYLI